MLQLPHPICALNLTSLPYYWEWLYEFLNNNFQVEFLFENTANKDLFSNQLNNQQFKSHLVKDTEFNYSTVIVNISELNNRENFDFKYSLNSKDNIFLVILNDLQKFDSITCDTLIRQIQDSHVVIWSSWLPEEIEMECSHENFFKISEKIYFLPPHIRLNYSLDVEWGELKKGLVVYDPLLAQNNNAWSNMHNAVVKLKTVSFISIEKKSPMDIIQLILEELKKGSFLNILMVLNDPQLEYVLFDFCHQVGVDAKHWTYYSFSPRRAEFYENPTNIISLQKNVKEEIFSRYSKLQDLWSSNLTFLFQQKISKKEIKTWKDEDIMSSILSKDQILYSQYELNLLETEAVVNIPVNLQYMNNFRSFYIFLCNLMHAGHADNKYLSYMVNSLVYGMIFGRYELPINTVMRNFLEKYQTQFDALGIFMYQSNQRIMNLFCRLAVYFYHCGLLKDAYDYLRIDANTKRIMWGCIEIEAELRKKIEDELDIKNICSLFEKANIL